MKSKFFEHALVISIFNLTQVPDRYCFALGALRKCANFFLSYHTVVVCLCAHSQHHVTDSSDRFMAKEKTARIHSPIFIDLVAEPMEPIHAELLRLATELEAVKGQVQTECNASRDLFGRTTTALTCTGSLTRPETEPQGSWETLATAIRWKPF